MSGRTALEQLYSDYHRWYERLPADKRQILIDQQRIRKLQRSRDMWLAYSNSSMGLALGTLNSFPDWHVRLIVASALFLFMIGAMHMRSRRRDELFKLEGDRDRRVMQELVDKSKS